MSRFPIDFNGNVTPDNTNYSNEEITSKLQKLSLSNDNESITNSNENSTMNSNSSDSEMELTEDNYSEVSSYEENYEENYEYGEGLHSYYNIAGEYQHIKEIFVTSAHEKICACNGMKCSICSKNLTKNIVTPAACNHGLCFKCYLTEKYNKCSVCDQQNDMYYHH